MPPGRLRGFHVAALRPPFVRLPGAAPADRGSPKLLERAAEVSPFPSSSWGSADYPNPPRAGGRQGLPQICQRHRHSWRHDAMGRLVLNVLELRSKVYDVDLPNRVFPSAPIELRRPAVFFEVGRIVRCRRHPLTWIDDIVRACRTNIIMGQPVKGANPKLPGCRAD